MTTLNHKDGCTYKAKLLQMLTEHFAGMDNEELADAAGSALDKEIIYEGYNFFRIDDVCPY